MTDQTKMTAAEFRAHVEALFGKHGGQTAAAEYFGIGPRSLRKFILDEKPVPDAIARETLKLRQDAPLGMLQIDPRHEIGRIQRLMEGSAWAADHAAAGILGAALANARKHCADETVSSLLEAK